MCHCHACQRRTGSAFGLQAGYDADRVRIEGRSREYARTSTEPDRRVHTLHFCPSCGSTVYSTEADAPQVVEIMVGAFGDRGFPAPSVSAYGAGDYAGVADRGRELIAAHPTNTQLIYNVACCESLSGRSADAIEHLPAGDRDRARPAARHGGRGLRPRRDPGRARIRLAPGIGVRAR